jgi:hypothetical protein
MYGFLSHRRAMLWLSLLFFTFQLKSSGQQDSRNGWVLPTEGTIRVLMVFVEIEYDENPSNDAYPNGHENWRVNELPEFRDDIFNVYQGEDSLKLLTQYYDETSFGQLQVLGDYYPEVITLKESEIGRSKSKLLKAVIDRLNTADIISNENLDFSDFDYWQNESKKGVVKEPSIEFSGVDHLMVLLRNFAPIPKDNGQASASSAGILGGFKTDTYSLFGGGSGLPFGILKHEFNHLLMGGNNLHSGGGNSARFRSYLLAVQGGWSMMGAANSSFLTSTGWDRYWLGWSPVGSSFEINALDQNRNEVNGDLNYTDEGGTYILRDYVKSGDALRIKLPFIPEEEFQQWIWVENHLTYAVNGSRTDRFIYEHYDCMPAARPGLYLNRQIDADVREGAKVYSSVYADYLKAIPATGAYDYLWDDEKLDLGPCVDNKPHHVYNLLAEFENPLTGHHELERPFYYTNNDDQITTENERSPGVRRNADSTYFMHPKAGDPDFGMRENEVEIIGIGTNPSTASTITHLNSRKGKSTYSGNSDAIYLNGIALRILETYPDLSMRVEVTYHDSLISEPRRWAGSEIILNDHNPHGSDLFVDAGLTLDRGKTITRFVQPDTVQGEVFFSSPTVLRIKSGARMTVEEEVILKKDSKIIVEDGGQLVLNRGSKLRFEDNSEVILEEGAVFSGKGKLKFRDNAGGRIADNSTFNQVKLRTCQRRRLQAMPSEAKP